MKVFEWVRAQRMFHDHATAEWDEKAGLYLTGRASAKEFIEGVRSRVGEGVWRPYLEPHVLRLFFRAKKNGLPDTYHKVPRQPRYSVGNEYSSHRPVTTLAPPFVGIHLYVLLEFTSCGSTDGAQLSVEC